MTGTISEAHLHELREEDDKQQKLFETDTRIAVVSDPVDDVFELCDEHIPELGMPLWKLNSFRKTRQALLSNSSTERHNKAYEIESCGEAYESYLRHNEAAAEAVDGLVSRVHSGENITLVCFEGDGKKCHRHTLKEWIENEI